MIAREPITPPRTVDLRACKHPLTYVYANLDRRCLVCGARLERTKPLADRASEMKGANP